MVVQKPSKLHIKVLHAAPFPRKRCHTAHRAVLASVAPTVGVCKPSCSPRCLLARSAQTATAVDSKDIKHPLFISFAGGGIYFFWQLGAVKYLVEHYDLTQVPMAGASSGSLVACLAACGVDPGLIVDEAYQLSIENDIWNRKFGLIGIWGGLIRGWLDKLLPDNAHKLVSGRLHVIIAKAPTLQLFEVSQFDSKEDLIEAVMASAHVPLFLDGRPFMKYREQLCWDGSFPDFFYFENSEYLKRGDKTLIVDYAFDKELNWQRGDFLKLRPYDEILELIAKGYRYMERQHEAGIVAERFLTDHVAVK